MDKVIYENDILGQITVCGIGKMVFESTKDFNIPHFHFISYQSSDGYTSLCLELGIHITEKAAEIAIKQMLNSCLSYLNETFMQKDDLNKLAEIVSINDYDDFWALYRKFEVFLAKEKRDLSSQFINEIKREAIADFVKASFVPEIIEYKTDVAEERKVA